MYISHSSSRVRACDALSAPSAVGTQYEDSAQALTSSGDFKDIVGDYSQILKLIKEKERNLQDLTGGDEDML